MYVWYVLFVCIIIIVRKLIYIFLCKKLGKSLLLKIIIVWLN